MSAAVRAPRHSASISDDELRDLIASQLDDCSLSTISVDVRNGTVILTGLVSSPFERQMAALAVRRIHGVRSLSDQVRVAAKPRPTTSQRGAEFAGDLLRAISDWFSGTPKSAWLVIVAGVLIPISLASCGSSEKQLAVHPVSGKVTFDGKPADGATVTLIPQGANPLKNTPSATAKADGTFDVSLYGSGDGAPAGDYVITVQWFKVVTDAGGSASRGPNVLPASYAKAETSPVKITVKEGKNELPPIEVKR